MIMILKAYCKNSRTIRPFLQYKGKMFFRTGNWIVDFVRFLILYWLKYQLFQKRQPSFPLREARCCCLNSWEAVDSRASTALSETGILDIEGFNATVETYIMIWQILDGLVESPNSRTEFIEIFYLSIRLFSGNKDTKSPCSTVGHRYLPDNWG